MTLVEIRCPPGSPAAIATSLGGAGSPDANYPLTQVANWLHTMEVTGLTGRWQFDISSGNAGTRIVEMVDNASITIKIGDIDYSELSTALALQLARLANRSTTLGDSTDVAVRRGTTWSIPLAILPGSWDTIEITARRKVSSTQSESLFHILVTNGGDAGDGLQLFDGIDSDDLTASDGSITEGDSETAATCVVEATSTIYSETGEFCWDAKIFDGTDVDWLAGGRLSVEEDVTRTPLT